MTVEAPLLDTSATVGATTENPSVAASVVDEAVAVIDIEVVALAARAPVEVEKDALEPDKATLPAVVQAKAEVADNDMDPTLASNEDEAIVIEVVVEPNFNLTLPTVLAPPPTLRIKLPDVPLTVFAAPDPRKMVPDVSVATVPVLRRTKPLVFEAAALPD